MKYKHIPIKIYDWDLYFFDMGKISKKDPILKKMNTLIGKDNAKEVKRIAYGNSVNGGDHYFDYKFKISVVIVYKTTSHKEKIGTIVHELQHSVDRICGGTKINDIEARAYLMQFVGMKILANI